MDEYDAPINHALLNFNDTDLALTLNLFKNINGSTFKSNKSLNRGLITGVFRIAKANLFSELNNLKEYSI